MSEESRKVDYRRLYHDWMNYRSTTQILRDGPFESFKAGYEAGMVAEREKWLPDPRSRWPNPRSR
jgi:hypothetical protein